MTCIALSRPVLVASLAALLTTACGANGGAYPPQRPGASNAPASEAAYPGSAPAAAETATAWAAQAVPRRTSMARAQATAAAKRTSSAALRPSATPLFRIPTQPVSTERPPTLPWEVRLSPAELEAELRERLVLPAIDLRVERAYYVTADDLREALAEAGDLPEDLPSYEDPLAVRTGVHWIDEPRRQVPPILTVVEGSHAGVHGAGDAIACPGPMEGLGPASADAPRRRFAWIRDASHGRLSFELGGRLPPRWPATVSDALAAKQPVTSWTEATPYPTNEPWPPPTPLAIASQAAETPLAPGQVPAALADVAREIPWVSGARWRYRVLRERDGVVTDAQARELRVEEARVLGDDRMLIAMAGPWQDDPERWVLGPEGAVAIFERAGAVADAAALDAYLVTPDIEEGVRRFQQVMTFPLGEPIPGWVWALESINEAVAVAAGRFEGCVQVQHVISAGSGERARFCPGVGLVWYSYGGLGGSRCHAELWELVDYEIPPLVPVP